MVIPKIAVTSSFAVPFGEARLANCGRLNRELEALFLARETEEFRNATPSHIAQAETFESRFNLFRWPDSCVRELREFMLNGVLQMVREVTQLSAETLARAHVQNHTWFHVTRYAGSFVAHNHPQASWSAVYCVRAGEAVPEHPGSGMLRFLDTRPGADAFQDAANQDLKSPYSFRPRQMHLEEGQLVIFPSFAFHEVAPFYGRDTRITVATNCWFT